jgi:hypothetical protein
MPLENLKSTTCVMVRTKSLVRLPVDSQTNLPQCAMSTSKSLDAPASDSTPPAMSMAGWSPTTLLTPDS